jgi:hypothetical protein
MVKTQIDQSRLSLKGEHEKREEMNIQNQKNESSLTAKRDP